MFVPDSGILGERGDARPFVPIPLRKIPETLNGGCGGSVAFLLVLIVVLFVVCCEESFLHSLFRVCPSIKDRFFRDLAPAVTVVTHALLLAFSRCRDAQLATWTFEAEAEAQTELKILRIS